MPCANETFGSYVRPSMVVYHYIKRKEAKFRAEQATVNRHLKSLDELRIQLFKSRSPVDVETTQIQFYELMPRYAEAFSTFKNSILNLNPQLIAHMMIEAGIPKEVARRFVRHAARRLARRCDAYVRHHKPERITEFFMERFAQYGPLCERLQEAKVKHSLAVWAAKERTVQDVVEQPLVVVLGENEKVETEGDEEVEVEEEVD